MMALLPLSKRVLALADDGDGDFGLAVVVDVSHGQVAEIAGHLAGVPVFGQPEAVPGKRHDPPAAVAAESF